jgi:hypothetical protein
MVQDRSSATRGDARLRRPFVAGAQGMYVLTRTFLRNSPRQRSRTPMTVAVPHR